MRTRNSILSGISLAFILGLVLFPSILTSREGAPDFAKEGVPFIEQYCFDCHSGASPAAELALDSFSDSRSLIEKPDIWEGVLDMLSTGFMPPSDSAQPLLEESEAFIKHVDSIFEHAARTAKPEPGRVTVRRLNKVEYKNTVRDLLGADFDPSENFPDDDVGYGFDNIGDVLSLSPLLMERYLEAAEAIVERVILVEPPPPSKRYVNARNLHPRHDDVPYERYRVLEPTATEPWKSGPFTTDAKSLKLIPDAELIYRATLYAETESETPVEVALFVQGEALEEFSTPDELAQLVGVNPAANNSIKILKTFEISAREPKKNQRIEVHVNRMPGIENAGIAMLKTPNGVPQAKLWIRTLWTEGPLETRPDSHFKILACTPDIPQAEQTREVLTRLLRRGYRRPPSAQEVERLAQFVASIQATGAKWEVGIQEAIKVILCSPKFLFRLELDDSPESPELRPIDEFQLASRLSYFLWSSMPDDRLLELAEKNQLTLQLESEVQRMLSEPKAGALARNFGFQWLQIQRLTTSTPDSGRFPKFTQRLKRAMFKETELFLASIFQENRSLLELLDADYTFLNQPLANHYGIADTEGNWLGQRATVPGGKRIKGRQFRRVKLQGDSRGGVLTHASVLTVTSNPTRTSPVKRGRWVLEQLLGAPPPPPPPDVPELEEEHEAVTGATLRQRLEQHREEPGCANCHAKMDAIGFALENYNAIGAFRQKDGNLKIDAAGILPDGTSFHGINGLKQILREREEEFARCLTEKMLTYALGRGLAYYDRTTVEKIVTQLKLNNYKFSVLITEIVKSEPFRLRRGTEESP